MKKEKREKETNEFRAPSVGERKEKRKKVRNRKKKRR